ncbi:MAG: endolytic transglycosylase MltG, partial [Burkholderiaceae bacterium]|nr:endolytic transglycosylase MltG [Burkholderiaceae bacterium]
MRRILIMGLLIAGLLAGAAAWWLNQPLALSSETVDLSIEPGTSPRGVAQAAAEAGVDVNPTLLFWWFRLSGDARQIRAGSYELARGATPRTLLQMLVRGEESLRSVTLVEGWNWRQVRQALSRAEQLRPDTENLSDEMIMSQLGRAGLPAEGRFFPDTYTYAKGSSDLAVLRRALHAMEKKLDAAWAQRAPDTPLKTPTEALILASIVEKETGKPGDRAMISGVFV